MTTLTNLHSDGAIRRREAAISKTFAQMARTYRPLTDQNPASFQLHVEQECGQHDFDAAILLSAAVKEIYDSELSTLEQRTTAMKNLGDIIKTNYGDIYFEIICKVTGIDREGKSGKQTKQKKSYIPSKEKIGAAKQLVFAIQQLALVSFSAPRRVGSFTPKAKHLPAHAKDSAYSTALS